MNDTVIVALFLDRNEEGILAAQSRYKKYCMSIALSILNQVQDAEECVNDAFLRAWESIPPKRPTILSAYLAKLTRNLSIDRLRERTADKRDERLSVALDEVQGILTGSDDMEERLDERELAAHIGKFLSGVSETKRLLFIGRYWEMQTVAELAKQFGMPENTVKSTLHRTREELKNFLTQEGYQV